MKNSTGRGARRFVAVTAMVLECLLMPVLKAAPQTRAALLDSTRPSVAARRAFCSACRFLHLHEQPTPAVAAEDKKPWTAADVITGEELSKVISSPDKAKPVVLQVGVEGLYKDAHIPDAIFAGPASEPEGLALLKSKTRSIARTKEIIIYCGCCPWQDCPNIKPAFVALKELGFRKVRLLSIPTDFYQDWVNKGFPTVKS